MTTEGILLINKPKGATAFSLVRQLRRLCGVRKIGHAGTLDPFATGVMVMLIGRNYTRRSDSFLTQDKEYIARARLGATTDTYDSEGEVTPVCDHVPSQEELDKALTHFQGTIEQIPPMYSAKKIDGKKLYQLARQGKTVERKPATVHVSTTILNYAYPYLDLQITCSKGTYIRSIAHDLGQRLGTGAYLEELVRSRSGHFALGDCIDGHLLDQQTLDLTTHLRCT